MQVTRLNYNTFFFKNINTCFYFRLKNLKTIWLFNCFEGCQHYLMKKKIKISQVSKIIITEMTIYNISGLPGLLSSLSLINKQKAVHIYGPPNLAKYLELTKEYSQTNFRYSIYFHKLKTNYIIQDKICQIYCLKKTFKFELIIQIPEHQGKFKLQTATQWEIEIGPLYGKLKKGYNFILPDGTKINSNNFTQKSQYGNKLSFVINKYLSRTHFINYCEKLIITSNN
uniref:ribonuclease Z n=1 Tax=Gracilaria urvillei TaxID=172974 RepID=UPI001D1111F9|nr:ribonuclease Z [Hydropuntia urvillei]UAD88351.1 ribonuclease Z [Hydropuntia urvillei]